MIDYEYLTDSAMRVLIKNVLTSISNHGITGEHHFHVSFMTQYDRVVIPKYLAERYPNEITIALQNQFKNLEVYEDSFGVDLSFSGKETRLVIPFCAVTAFADPSVDFTLRMNPDNMGMLGKSKFHEMISGGTQKHDDEDDPENNVINFADIQDKLK